MPSRKQNARRAPNPAAASAAAAAAAPPPAAASAGSALPPPPAYTQQSAGGRGRRNDPVPGRGSDPNHRRRGSGDNNSSSARRAGPNPAGAAYRGAGGAGVTNQNGDRVDTNRSAGAGGSSRRVVHRVGMDCLSPINTSRGDGPSGGGESFFARPSEWDNQRTRQIVVRSEMSTGVTWRILRRLDCAAVLAVCSVIWMQPSY